MSERKWFKGAPPFPGWWNASDCRNREAWRWWNGTCWGTVSFSWWTARVAGANAAMPDYRLTSIEWRHDYPANARVPRIDPRIKP